MSSPNASDPAPRRRGAASSAAPTPLPASSAAPTPLPASSASASASASAAAAAAADQVDPFPPPFPVLDFEDDVLPDPDWGSDDVFTGTDMIYLPEPPPADVGFDTDTDTDDQIVAIGNEIDRALAGALADADAALCWDCLRIEDEAREEFEWEEVDDPLDEREVLTMMLASEDDARGFEDVNGRNNIDWELLGANFADDQEGFVYTSEYDVLVGQFAEHDSGKGAPPASKSVVDNLPFVVLTEETTCAVCKDEIAAGERSRKLPCAHHYHDECILQWLGIRNTCPLCRFELPTDDVEYENWKAQRVGSETSVEEGRLRFGFEILPEMDEM